MERKIIPLFPKWWPWVAMAFIHWIFIRKDYELSPEQLQHERIHLQQQRELWYVGFFLIYILEFFLRFVCNDFKWMQAYKRISFEQEANALDNIVWEELETFRHQHYWMMFLVADIRKYLRTEWWPYAGALLLTLYIGIDQVDRHRSPDPHVEQLFSSVGSYQPSIDTIDLLDLHREYEANELRADRAYKGHHLFTWGRVDRVSSTIDKRGLVEIYNGEARAYAYFNEDQKGTLLQLEKYKTIGITCTCSGRMLWVVQLNDCQVTAWSQE